MARPGHRDGIADLSVAVAQCALEVPVIRETLDACIFQHRERAHLRGVAQQGGLLHGAGDKGWGGLLRDSRR